jgi:hypothetical protein
LRPLIHANFKPVAQVAVQLIAAGFAWDVEEVHGTTGWVISDLRTNPYPVNALQECEFQDMFTDVWCRLVCEAELEAPPLPPTQTMPAHGDGDARSPSQTSEAAGAVDEDESAAERRRKTQQIGDRAASSLPPRSGSPVQGEEVRHTPVSIIERIRSSKKKPLYLVIEMFKAEHPSESDTKAILKGVDAMITDIGSEGEQKRVRKDVHESVPPRWQERIGVQTTLVAYWDKSDPKERGRIKTYVSDVKVIQ